jgi:rare lipoprotein A
LKTKHLLLVHLKFFALTTFAGFPQPLPAQQKTAAPASATIGKKQTGMAIFYSDKFHGHPLTSGEKYDKNALSAAHRTLPLGTVVKVTNLKNNKTVVVRINDRGPHGPKTDIIDISGRAAQELDMIKDGRAKVTVEVVEATQK